MKRKWEEPRIEVQKFEANEYVAACISVEQILLFSSPLRRPMENQILRKSIGWDLEMMIGIFLLVRKIR